MSINPFEVQIRVYLDSLPDVIIYEEDLDNFLREISHQTERVPIGTYGDSRGAGVIFVKYTEDPLGIKIWHLSILGNIQNNRSNQLIV